MKKNLVFCCVLTSFAVVNIANADILFNLIETGGNVQSTLSGSFNLDATLEYQGVAPNIIRFFDPPVGTITNGDGMSDYYAIDAHWVPYGTGPFDTWDATSGDRVALFLGFSLGVPIGYSSGDALSGTSTKFDATFESLGMSTGTYVTTLTNGRVSDTVTVRVGIPEPGNFLVLSVTGLGAIRRKRYK